MEIGFSFRDSKSSTANWTYGSTTKEARIQLERSDTNTEYEEYEEKVYNIKLYEEIPKDSSKTIQLDDYQMYTYESITNIYVEDENLGRIPFEVAYIKTEILE